MQDHLAAPFFAAGRESRQYDFGSSDRNLFVQRHEPGARISLSIPATGREGDIPSDPAYDRWLSAFERPDELLAVWGALWACPDEVAFARTVERLRPHGLRLRSRHFSVERDDAGRRALLELFLAGHGAGDSVWFRAADGFLVTFRGGATAGLDVFGAEPLPVVERVAAGRSWGRSARFEGWVDEGRGRARVAHEPSTGGRRLEVGLDDVYAVLVEVDDLVDGAWAGASGALSHPVQDRGRRAG